MMKVSIVTAVFNRVYCIENAIKSVQQQSYKNIEHIIIDGASTDGTLARISESINDKSILISERDLGIYDALNKGFLRASGDIIGILHSDDIFFDDQVIEKVVFAFENQCPDFVYGDIVMISDDDKIKRYWRSGQLKGGFITAAQIPHPALFISKDLLSILKQPFDPSYKIAADLKQQLIIANKLRCKGTYISCFFVKMKIGGLSTSSLSAYIEGWVESRRAWNEVHRSGGFRYVIRKVLSKFSGIRF